MSLPWGVKEIIEPEHAEKVIEYFKTIEGNTVTLDCGTVTNILKAGIKERKGKYTLIFRYQLG